MTLTMDEELADVPDFDSGAAEDIGDIPGLPENFSVHDEASANWVLRKVVEARAYREHVRAWAEREIKSADREDEWFMQRFGPELSAWASKRISEQGGKKRSVALPAGIAGFRKEPSRLVLKDEAAAMAWAKRLHPELVVLVPETERLSKADLNALVKSTGEVPDGGVITEERDAFYVK